MNTIKIQELIILVKFQKSNDLEHTRTFHPKVTTTVTTINASHISHHKEKSTLGFLWVLMTVRFA